MNNTNSAPAWRPPSLDSLRQDLRYALRTLRSSPGFAAVAILTLALGIGANTAIFSLVSTVLLRPLPFTEPSRLVLLWENFTGVGGPDRVEPAAATVVQWKARTHSFDDITMFVTQPYNLTGGGEPERLMGIRTDTSLFSVLGLRPILGRTFVADDEGPDATPVVVLSERLWQRRFGADPALVGQTIVLDGLARTVIGVVPQDFRFPNTETSVWVPASYSPAELANANAYNYYAIARLAPASTSRRRRPSSTRSRSRCRASGPNGAGQSQFTVTLLQEHLARARAADAVHAARGRRRDPPDHLRERREPAARARRAARAGARGPQGDRRRGRARAPPAADRERGARRGRASCSASRCRRSRSRTSRA